MDIEGQGCAGPKRLSSHPHTRFDDGGFTMVVLLVVIAIMAVGMTAMLPTWRQQAIREKEEELIFRGNQYARALVLYSRKNNNLLPANIDLLYEGRYLRKKWKDPITNADFGLLAAGTPANAGQGNPQGLGAPGRGRSGAPPAQSPQGTRGAGPGTTGQQVFGSIQGVYSTSTDTSIRVYQNQQRYIDWQFTVQTALSLMGGARGGGPGGQRGGGPGGVPGRGGPGRGAPGVPGVGVPGRGGPVGQPPRGVGPGGRSGIPVPPGGRGRGNF